jgi:hypothetical protein
MTKAIRSLMIVSGAYLAAQMLADIASLRIIEIGGQAVDAGTLIYSFTFTLVTSSTRSPGRAQPGS